MRGPIIGRIASAVVASAVLTGVLVAGSGVAAAIPADAVPSSGSLGFTPADPPAGGSLEAVGSSAIPVLPPFYDEFVVFAGEFLAELPLGSLFPDTCGGFCPGQG